MGYCSCFSLSAKPMTQDLYQKIDAELQLYTCYFEQDGIENGVGHWCNQDDTWYSCRADMIQLSRTFPDVYFQLYVEGEDHIRRTMLSVSMSPSSLMNSLMEMPARKCRKMRTSFGPRGKALAGQLSITAFASFWAEKKTSSPGIQNSWMQRKLRARIF